MTRLLSLVALVAIGCTASEESETALKADANSSHPVPHSQEWPRYAEGRGWTDHDRISLGITAEELHSYFANKMIDTGTVYWGGTGARRVYFHLPNNKQIWFDVERLIGVCEIGPVEDKMRWKRYSDDSILVGSMIPGGAEDKVEP